MPMSPVNPGGAGVGSVADALLGLVVPELPAAVVGDAASDHRAAFAQILDSLLGEVNKPTEHIDLEGIDAIAAVTDGGVAVAAETDVELLRNAGSGPAGDATEPALTNGSNAPTAVAVPAVGWASSLVLAAAPTLRAAAAALVAGKVLPPADTSLPPAGSGAPAGAAAKPPDPVSAEAPFASGSVRPNHSAVPPAVGSPSPSPSPSPHQPVAAPVVARRAAGVPALAQGSVTPPVAAAAFEVAAPQAADRAVAPPVVAGALPAGGLTPPATARAGVEGALAAGSTRAIPTASADGAAERVRTGNATSAGVGNAARQPAPSWASGRPPEAAAQRPSISPASDRSPSAAGGGAGAVPPGQNPATAPVAASGRAAPAVGAVAMERVAPSERGTVPVPAAGTEPVAPSPRAAQAVARTEASARYRRAGQVDPSPESSRRVARVENAGTDTLPAVAATPGGRVAAEGGLAWTSALLPEDPPATGTTPRGAEALAPGTQPAVGPHPLGAAAAASPATDAGARAPFAPLVFGEAAQWAGELDARVRWFAGRGIGTAEIRLDPPDLGPLQVTVHTQREGASVHFSAANASVRDLLEHSLPRLRELLESGGMNLVDVNVTHQRHGGGYRDAPPEPGTGLVAATHPGSDAVARDAPARITRGIIDAYV